MLKCKAVLKASSIVLVYGAVFFTALLFLGFSPSKISPRLQQKLNAAVETTFDVEEYELKHIVVNQNLNGQTQVELGGENLFAVEAKGTVEGYAYLGQAPSMKNIFDYVVLFNPDLTIKKSKVLIYREDYGRQIGSQRWLKQFIGKKHGDQLDYGDDIDAISGATISAKSMTKAVNDVLQSIALLQKENAI